MLIFWKFLLSFPWKFCGLNAFFRSSAPSLNFYTNSNLIQYSFNNKNSKNAKCSFISHLQNNLPSCDCFLRAINCLGITLATLSYSRGMKIHSPENFRKMPTASFPVVLVLQRFTPWYTHCTESVKRTLMVVNHAWQQVFIVSY